MDTSVYMLNASNPSLFSELAPERLAKITLDSASPEHHFWGENQGCICALNSTDIGTCEVCMLIKRGHLDPLKAHEYMNCAPDCLHRAYERQVAA